MEGSDTFEGVYLVRTRNLRTTRSGSPYLQMELADRTGTAKAMCWQVPPQIVDEISENSFVSIKARTEIYQGKLQIIVDRINPVDASEVDLADFLSQSRFDNDQLWERFIEIISLISDESLKSLTEAFCNDEELVAKFRKSSAAMVHHHACVGGLLEHTVGVMELALLVGGRYEVLNSDLLLVGAVFHDIGKTEELSCSTGFSYTDIGGLVGHISIGAQMVDSLAARVKGFPAEKLNLIKHLILSHHGQMEFGAPVVPRTAEAVALNLIDNIDAKMEGARAAFERMPSADSWTSWEKMFDTRLYKGSTE